MQSQDSCDAAVRTVLDATGQLDVVIHNAGHLYVGYTEAFTAEDVNHLFDINATGVQRLNRSALAHMRERGDDGNPVVVATEITRILGLPKGEKPYRSVVDLTHAYVERANAVNQEVRENFVRRMGFEQLLRVTQ